MSKASVTTEFQPFTWKTYELYLRTALESGYHFIGFDALRGRSTLPEHPFILLRHDIDYDPIWALPMSKIEVENKIQATYFFQIDSPFYELNCPETISIIEEILHQGHWLGVHFDANQIKDDAEVAEELERTAALFEKKFSTSIAAASFHMPTYRPVKHLHLKGKRINTYSPLFFEHIQYFSDSNQDWRGKDVLKALWQKDFSKIQFLVHPIWWRETYSPFYSKLEELARKLNIPMDSILTREQLDLISKWKAG
jgi:hypothetical protein